MPILNRFRGQRVAAVAPVAQQTVTTTTTTAPVIGREKLVSHAVVPGQRIKEVDVVSRKKVPYYQERELYEGPAQYEVINGGAREYASATTTATNGRLIGHQTLPGQRIKEVDVVSRKKVPYYEERQVYEGPAQMQVINGGQREYASATSTATGGRLIGHQTLPGQRIKEVDVVSRKKVPYYEERQVYEGPAQMQVINGGQREYASATSTATGGRLIGHQTLPGQRIKEVDVISRKKIPYYEQRELYEGPAQLQVINGGEREYVSATSTAKGGRLIGHKTLPGQRIKEVDVVSRKKVPYYQERELYEGPAQYEVINGGQREYVSATSTATNGRLIGSRKLPGQRIKEVDVVSRKKVPYYQERELYEGPAQYEFINGGAREYVSATSTATNGRLIGARKLPGARVKEVDVVSRKKVPYYMEKELYEGPASFEVIQGPVREYYRGSTNVAAANLSGASFTSTGSSIGSTGFVHRRRFGSGLLHRLRRPRYYQTSSVGSLGSVGSVSSVGSASSFSSGHSVYSLSGSSLSSGSLGSVGHHGYRASRILDRFRTRRHFKTAGIAAAQGLEGGKTMTAPAHGAYRAPTVSTRRVPIRDRVKSKVLRRPVVTKYY